MIHKIFETDFSFHVKKRTTERILISVFQKSFAIINKILILAERLGTSLSFYEVLRLF